MNVAAAQKNPDQSGNHREAIKHKYSFGRNGNSTESPGNGLPDGSAPKRPERFIGSDVHGNQRSQELEQAGRKLTAARGRDLVSNSGCGLAPEAGD